ncbi:MAG: UDP-N-acetylglucosamine--N-acetylmuramyl-(pentapeptide) pyrophosphoryl-undecaprenol N-acetylglucosamine transferase [candidate division WOR-3 bacterium]|nr:UDP-N-acetylglucosamine--N-acetylmuramyl-(pentapeptide) pyrophosphoryl-undecaprenol N-acetylglucosamine transferase [candidate division WOR-3 bacterium]
MKKTIVVSGGGTGGHIYPALSIADKLEKRGLKTVYIGSSKGLERELVQKEKRFLLPTIGWVDRKFLGKIAFILRFIPSLIFSIYILWSNRVNAIFHTGGFASLPVGIAGIILRIPIFTLVLDSHPGQAVRLLSRFSKEIFLPFPGDFPSLPHGKWSVTGIPIREDILSGDPEEAIEYFSLNPQRKTLLVLGGSRGARFLVKLADSLIEEMGEGWQFIVQTGSFELNRNLKWVYSFPFIKRMDLAYSASDVIISRAGALTSAEIEQLGISAILIPYPYAYKDHQFWNAKRLAKTRDNIKVIREEEVDPAKLPELIKNLSEKKSKVKSEDATEKIIERMKEYVWKD